MEQNHRGTAKPFPRALAEALIAGVTAAALSLAEKTAYGLLYPGILRFPRRIIPFALAGGAVLCLLALFLRITGRVKRPSVLALVLCPVILLTNYEAVVTKDTAAAPLAFTLRDDFSELRLGISGDFETAAVFSIELERYGGGAIEKLLIDGLVPDPEIAESRYYRPRTGTFTIQGQFRRGDRIRVNKNKMTGFLNAPGSGAKIIFDLRGQKSGGSE